MPRILLNRIGDDTLAKLEAAATRRHAEARRLAAHEPLGALYLFGYTVEMRLKAAYYRLVGVPMNWNIENPLVAGADSPRRHAQRSIQGLVGLGSPNAAGHHLVGWATLLIDTRSHHALGGYPGVFQQALSDHAQAVGRQWKETLRYRANRPYDEELDEVIAAARWVQQNYRRLWN